MPKHAKAPHKRPVTDKATQLSKTHFTLVSAVGCSSPAAWSIQYLTLLLTAGLRSSLMCVKLKGYCPLWHPFSCYALTYSTCPASAWSPHIFKLPQFSFQQPWTHYSQKPKGMWPYHSVQHLTHRVTLPLQVKKIAKTKRLVLPGVLLTFYTVSSAVKSKREAWAFWHWGPEMELEALMMDRL